LSIALVRMPWRSEPAPGSVIAMELIEEGVWKGAGVLGPEAFEPKPFMERMAGYGFPYGVMEK
jgi:saccharopine dehydrogenase-like NADP-dependent oxidoreductase